MTQQLGYRPPNFLARVVSKSGTTVTVRRDGDPATAATLGPYACEAGVSGLVLAGDLVLVDRSSVTPLVRMPVEASERLALNIVGSDTSLGTTTSVSTYVTLLDVQGLAIPADKGLSLQYHIETAVVGTAGGSLKGLLLLFNDAPNVDILLSGSDTGGTTHFSPWIVSAYADFPDNPGRVAELLNAGGQIVDVGEINRIRIQGKTNDGVDGNDIIRATNLEVRL